MPEPLDTSPPEVTSADPFRTVPAEAVVPAERGRGSDHPRPEHLYKAVGLLFLLAILYRYLEPIVRVLLLAYAAAIVAVAVNAVVRALPGRRAWLTVLVGLGVLASAGAALWFGIPFVLAQLRDVAGRMPELTLLLQRLQQWVQAHTGFEVQLVGPEGQRFWRQLLVGITGGADVMASVQGLLGALLLPVLVLFGGLYAAARPNDRLLTPLLRLVPRDHRLALRRAFQLLGERLLGWLRGLLIGMAGVALLSLVLFSLIGLHNALLLALLAGLTEAIPLVGPLVGGAFAVGMAFLQGPTTALYTALAAVAIQQVENHLLLPWAMSRAAEVHPFVTLFALLLFGSLFGLLGALLAIPLVLLLTTLVQVFWVERALDTDRDAIAPIVDE